MEKDVKLPKALQNILETASTASPEQLIKLIKNPLIRKTVIQKTEEFMLGNLKRSYSDPEVLPGIAEDKTSMGLGIVGSIERALEKGRLSDAYLKGMTQTLIKTLFIDRGDMPKRNKFKKQFGQNSPSFLLISPTKACNLRCKGCYADSADQKNTLEWDIVDRMVNEAKTLWGCRFFVISGGEPFAYHSEGKTIVDLIEKNQDCFFMTYTNSTLITPEISRRISEAGNMLLCISVEGMKEKTDDRRGVGVFDKVLQSMALLKKDGVPFGLSLTGTRYNYKEILSDDFFEFFLDKGALFAWLFQYMPIGRAFTLDLMVTPQQRVWMWKHSWDIVRNHRIFLADFWNNGTLVDGCLSAGGHGNGGYFHVDWNGAVTPCVFVPYSPVNIKDVYAAGGNLNDVWKNPFFQSIRNWQCQYQKNKRNGLAPCPNRDHHDELEVLLKKYEPNPTDANAAATLTDPDYTRGLVAYNHEFETLTNGIWKDHYMRKEVDPDKGLPPLPDLPQPCCRCKSFEFEVTSEIQAQEIKDLV